GAEAGPATPGDAVAVATAVVDGRTVAVVRRRDNTVVARDLETGTPLGPPMGTPREYSFGRLVVVEVDGEPVVVALEPTGRQLPGPFDMTEEQVGVSSFALRTGAPAGPVLAADGASIDAFSVTEIDGRPVVVSSTAGGGGVQARDLRTGAPVGAPTAPQPVAFRALTTAVRDGVPVAVTGGDDNTVRIWDLRTGEQVGAPLAGHVESVTAVVAVQQDGRTVLITAGGSDLSPTPQVRFWELATGTPLGPRMPDHPLSRGFRALSPDGSLLLTTAPGEPVAVWDAKQLVAEVASCSARCSARTGSSRSSDAAGWARSTGPSTPSRVAGGWPSRSSPRPCPTTRSSPPVSGGRRRSPPGSPTRTSCRSTATARSTGGCSSSCSSSTAGRSPRCSPRRGRWTPRGRSRSSSRWPARSTPLTPKGWCTATSRRPTSC